MPNALSFVKKKEVKSWNWYKRDARNIKALANRFGNVRIRTFPTYSTFDFIFDEFFRGIHWVSFLDYLPFNKSEALDVLERDYGFKRYPYKHYESIFTRFYQGYILPQKFGVDKRFLHLGTLVAAGQMTRDEAMLGLDGIPYLSHTDLESDIQYFIKKMGWSSADLATYIERPEVRHDAYPNENCTYQMLLKMMGPTVKKTIQQWLRR